MIGVHAPPARSGHGSAQGKLILIGEHWVLDGAAALAVALPQWRTDVTLRQAQPGSGIALRTDAGLDPHQTEQSLAMARLACHQGGVHHATVDVATNLLLRRRLGSSAAFAVALVRAVAQCTGDVLDDVALLARARALEAIVHGSSSGLDPAAASADCGGILFQSGMVVQRIAAIGTGLSAAQWVLADVGQGQPSQVAIAHARRCREAMAQTQRSLWSAKVTAAARDGACALRDGAVPLLVVALQQAAAASAALDVTTAPMRACLAAMVSAGALAAKPTGAGMGGTLLALAADAAQAERIAASCRSSTVATHIVPVCAALAAPRAGAHADASCL